MLSDLIQLPFRYLAWHYGRAILESLSLWRLGFRFVTRLCAVPLHLRTLFAPFERLGEEVAGGLGDRFESFLVNSVMRLVGFAARLGVLALALAGYAAVAALGLAGLAGWLALPPALLASLWIGARGLGGGSFDAL
jgi:hypothetical protein